MPGELCLPSNRIQRLNSSQQYTRVCSCNHHFWLAGTEFSSPVTYLCRKGSTGLDLVLGNGCITRQQMALIEYKTDKRVQMKTEYWTALIDNRCNITFLPTNL